MARYIDTDRYSFPTLHQKELNDYMKGWNTCLKSVLQQPTADVVEKAELVAVIAAQETLQKHIAEKDARIEDLIKQRDRAFLESRRIVRRNGELRDEINASKKAKSEAIKEFAERLKAKLHFRKSIGFPITIYEIDNLVKEMVGD